MDTITKSRRHTVMSHIRGKDSKVKIERVTEQIIKRLDETTDPELEIRGFNVDVGVVECNSNS